MSKLNSFKLPAKRKSRTRVGRGNGSKGTYSGRGLKGQKSSEVELPNWIDLFLNELFLEFKKERG